MGAIVDHEQHVKDVAEMRAIVELQPVVARYLSHHLRNSLAGAINALHLDRQKDVYDALMHIVADLEAVNL
jgi:hypothetical protein